MKLHRFYIEENLVNKSDLLITREDLVNQLKNVFRFSNGDQIILFDNSGSDFLFEINSIDKKSVSLKLIEVHGNVSGKLREIFLFASLVKKDNFEWISQKATELGVSHIIPIISSRSEKKDINVERIKKIIIEASEQSGRTTLPVLHEVMNLNSAVSQFGNIKSIAWEPSAIKFNSSDIDDCVGVYIGPEGGWSEQDLKLFSDNNIQVKSLGPQILRSETAVIVAVSQLLF